MKRNTYFVKSYDGKIEKTFRNYANAIKFCNKLIWSDIPCSISIFDCDKMEMVEIAGC